MFAAYRESPTHNWIVFQQWNFLESANSQAVRRIVSQPLWISTWSEEDKSIKIGNPFAIRMRPIGIEI